MIKITAGVQKKVPIDGVEFSSQSYFAEISVEVDPTQIEGEQAEKVAEVRSRLDGLFGLVEASVDDQISASRTR